MIPSSFTPSKKRARLLYQVLRLGELKSRQQIFDAVGFMLTNDAAAELRSEVEVYGYNVVHSMTGRLHCYKLVRDSSTEEARTRSGVVSVPQSTERAGGHGGQMPQLDEGDVGEGADLIGSGLGESVGTSDDADESNLAPSPTSPESDGLAGALVVRPHCAGAPDRGARAEIDEPCETHTLPPAPANPSDVTSEPTVPISLNPTSEIARPPGEMGRSAADTFKQLELVA